MVVPRSLAQETPVSPGDRRSPFDPERARCRCRPNEYPSINIPSPHLSANLASLHPPALSQHHHHHLRAVYHHHHLLLLLPRLLLHLLLHLHLHLHLLLLHLHLLLLLLRRRRRCCYRMLSRVQIGNCRRSYSYPSGRRCTKRRPAWRLSCPVIGVNLIRKHAQA